MCSLLGTVSLASPPVPPPEEGFVISVNVDVECLGDVTETESHEWNYVKDMDPEEWGPRPGGHPSSSVGPEDLYLSVFGRAGQVRYDETLSAVDGTTQLKKRFEAGSHSDEAITVSKDIGYVAQAESLIAIAEDSEKLGLSIVANGDAEGLGDIPSLCPWVARSAIPATNEFIAAGSGFTTTSEMVSHTDSAVKSIVAPSLDHSIAASGTGSVNAAMKASLMEGDSLYYPELDAHMYGGPAVYVGFPGPPNLISKTVYDEKSVATGAIDKFNKTMHYHSTIPQHQMPEPWYLLQ